MKTIMVHKLRQYHLIRQLPTALRRHRFQMSMMRGRRHILVLLITFTIEVITASKNRAQGNVRPQWIRTHMLPHHRCPIHQTLGIHKSIRHTISILREKGPVMMQLQHNHIPIPWVHSILAETMQHVSRLRLIEPGIRRIDN